MVDLDLDIKWEFAGLKADLSSFSVEQVTFHVCLPDRHVKTRINLDKHIL